MSSENQDYIEASINLFVDDKTRHWGYFGAKRQASIHDVDWHSPSVTRNVKIHNGRGNEELKLDEASFELVKCPTSLSKEDFYDMQQNGNADLIEKYHEEVTNFVKSSLGCDKVVCFHHQVRNAEKVGEGGVQPYAGFAPHTDSSAVSADQLAFSLVKDDPEKYERYLYVNLWRNIADEPIENDHLAMLDERTTVKPDDYIVKDLFMAGGHSVVQYELNARHAGTHKWYHFPSMERNEGILFKQHDSDWTKPGRLCFHMSVNDAKVTNHRPRESIELRMMCFWKNADSGVDSMPTAENINPDMIKNPLEYAEEMSSRSSFPNPFKYFLGLFRKSPPSKYSGKPEDYLDRFVQVFGYYSQWPSAAKTWAKQQMEKHPDNVQAGIEEITKALVDDSFGYQKTKGFTKDEKEAIVKFLLKNEKYCNKAEGCLKPLLES